MSVESEILRIQRNVADTYAAVAEKGGTVPLQPNSENLPAAVSSIPAGGSGSAEEIYSTEETRIGTWIDGKPLYRRVFQVTCPPAGAYQIVIPSSDLPNMRIKRIDGYLYSNSNPAGGPINFAYSRAYIATWNYAGDIYMETNNADYANSPAEIIFEYTKTTD